MNKLILNFKSKDAKKIKYPKNFIGGKGANLSEMGRMGLPVPPGFTISTKVCEIFFKKLWSIHFKFAFKALLVKIYSANLVFYVIKIVSWYNYIIITSHIAKQPNHAALIKFHKLFCNLCFLSCF